MLAVTTSLRDGNQSVKALETSITLGVPYLPRENKSIDDLLTEYHLKGILVVGKKRITYKYPGGEFFFHPGMAKLRINEILNGKTDQMIKALDLKPGDKVLDCTLGLGADAIVIAFINDSGEVTGIEFSPVISLIVKEGLASYNDLDTEIGMAMKRINVICADYNDFLEGQADNSVDVVYFDPMFRIPGKKSCAIEAMRPLTNNSSLSRQAINNALRVARKRVVIKESRNSAELLKLGVDCISGGRYSQVAYGIIEKRGGCHHIQ